MRRLALFLVLGVAGCGGSSATRNEAAWAQAQQWAREYEQPNAALVGAARARAVEHELAEADYRTLIAKEDRP